MKFSQNYHKLLSPKLCNRSLLLQIFDQHGRQAQSVNVIAPDNGQNFEAAQMLQRWYVGPVRYGVQQSDHRVTSSNHAILLGRSETSPNVVNIQTRYYEKSYIWSSAGTGTPFSNSTGSGRTKIVIGDTDEFFEHSTRCSMRSTNEACVLWGWPNENDPETPDSPTKDNIQIRDMTEGQCLALAEYRRLIFQHIKIVSYTCHINLSLFECFITNVTFFIKIDSHIYRIRKIIDRIIIIFIRCVVQKSPKINVSS